MAVEGIGPVRTGALQAWKAALEARARASAPKAISVAEEATIRAKFRNRRDSLKSERDRYQLQLLDEERAARAKNQISLDALADEEAKLRKDMSDREAEVRARA